MKLYRADAGELSEYSKTNCLGPDGPVPFSPEEARVIIEYHPNKEFCFDDIDHSFYTVNKNVNPGKINADDNLNNLAIESKRNLDLMFLATQNDLFVHPVELETEFDFRLEHYEHELHDRATIRTLYEKIKLHNFELYVRPPFWSPDNIVSWFGTFDGDFKITGDEAAAMHRYLCYGEGNIGSMADSSGPVIFDRENRPAAPGQTFTPESLAVTACTICTTAYYSSGGMTAGHLADFLLLKKLEMRVGAAAGRARGASDADRINSVLEADMRHVPGTASRHPGGSYYLPFAFGNPSMLRRQLVEFASDNSVSPSQAFTGIIDFCIAKDISVNEIDNLFKANSCAGPEGRRKFIEEFFNRRGNRDMRCR